MINVDSLKKEYEEILNQLSDPGLISDWEKFEELSKKKNSLEKALEKEKEIEEINNKIEENKVIITAREDSELVSLAESELTQLAEREKILEKELEELLRERGNTTRQNSARQNLDGQDVIVEIRAGTGGQEAGLFVADLFRIIENALLLRL